MKHHLKLISIFFLSLAIVYGSFLISANNPKNTDVGIKPSILKTKYINPSSRIIRIEIEVLDDTKKDFNDILEVKFNNKQIPLLKAGASGRRARKYYQVKPGTYTLKWKVSKGKTWPRSKTFEKEITLNETDKFAYILIEGEKVTVTTSWINDESI